jgi:hypothetical protein
MLHKASLEKSSASTSVASSVATAAVLQHLYAVSCNSNSHYRSEYVMLRVVSGRPLIPQRTCVTVCTRIYDSCPTAAYALQCITV